MPRRRLARHAAAVLVAWSALALVHRQTLGQFFFLEDCQLILAARDTSWSELLARHFLRPYWNEEQLFWRPGWTALFKLLEGAFGSDPRAYMATGLALQAALVVLVHATAAAAAGSALAGLGAALLFATTPATAEAVVWPSASLNVLPAALCVAAAGLALRRWLEGGGAQSFAALLAAFTASLLFREAAYHLVVLLPAAAWILRASGGLRPARLAAGFASLAALVLAHFLFLNTTWLRGGQAGAAGLLDSLGAFAALFVPGLAPGAALLGAALLALPAWILAAPRTRFFLAWSACALFPYVAVGPASRFTVFPALPLAVALALLGHDVARKARAPALRRLPAALVVALVVALVAAQVPALAARLGEYRAKGELYRRVRDWGRANLGGFERVQLALRHPSQAGLAQTLALFLPGGPAVEELWAVRKGPFLLYDGELPVDGPGRALVQVDVKSGAARFLPRAELVPPGATAVPSAEFRHAWRLAAPGEVPAGPAADGTLVLARAPGLALAPADLGRNRVLYRQFHPHGVAYKLRCETDALFVVRSFYARTDLALREARVDGRRVEPIAADGLFLAIPLPAGTRTLALRGEKR
jgi:hypothetical protein